MPINSLGVKFEKRIGMRKAKAPVARNTAITSSLHPARPQIGEEGLILVVSSRAGQPSWRYPAGTCCDNLIHAGGGWTHAAAELETSPEQHHSALRDLDKR